MPRLRFIPREKIFFQQFRDSAQNLVESARAFKEMVDDFSDPRGMHNRIVDLEHRGDDITHGIMRALNTTFVTPIDREDIHLLAAGLDDVVDLIEAAADVLVLHNIEKPTDQVRQQAEVLLRACVSVEAGVRGLERFKGLEEYWIAVHRIENEGDKIYRKTVADLFNGEHRAMEVLKWKEIYDQVEAAIDGCEKIATTLESIVLKHA